MLTSSTIIKPDKKELDENSIFITSTQNQIVDLKQLILKSFTAQHMNDLFNIWNWSKVIDTSY